MWIRNFTEHGKNMVKMVKYKDGLTHHEFMKKILLEKRKECLVKMKEVIEWMSYQPDSFLEIYKTYAEESVRLKNQLKKYI